MSKSVDRETGFEQRELTIEEIEAVAGGPGGGAVGWHGGGGARPPLPAPPTPLPGNYSGLYDGGPDNRHILPP